MMMMSPFWSQAAPLRQIIIVTRRFSFSLPHALEILNNMTKFLFHISLKLISKVCYKKKSHMSSTWCLRPFLMLSNYTDLGLKWCVWVCLFVYSQEIVFTYHPLQQTSGGLWCSGLSARGIYTSVGRPGLWPSACFQYRIHILKIMSRNEYHALTVDLRLRKKKTFMNKKLHFLLHSFFHFHPVLYDPQ